MPLSRQKFMCVADKHEGCLSHKTVHTKGALRLSEYRDFVCWNNLKSLKQWLKPMFFANL